MKNPIKSPWWFQPLWKIWVSWDYYSQYMEKHVPNHQPVMYIQNSTHFFLHLKMAKHLIFTGNPCCFNRKNLDSAWSHPCTARLHSCTAPCLIRWSYASPMASGCSEVSSVLLAQVIWLGDFHNIFWGCNTNQQVVETKIRRFILCLANIWLDISKYNPNARIFTNMYPNNCTHVGK